MLKESLYFKWPDYLVLSIVLLMSAAIGFYYACTGGKQRTTREYLLADRNMHWFPVACSLTVSFISSNTLLGLPGEIYTFGTVILLGLLSRPFALALCAKVYLPIFRRVGAMSMFEYIFLRFGRVMKMVAVFEYILVSLMYCSLVIYGPALSISAVTGMNLWLGVCSVGLIAMLYTILGGLKAVLWTDTLQFIIMTAGILAVLIYGTAMAGGVSEVWRINKLSGRLDILEPSKIFNFDPRARHTLWTQLFNGMFLYLTSHGLNQIAVQRTLALRPKPHYLSLAYGTVTILSVLLELICGLTGLVIFAHYQLCDPQSDGLVVSKDQLQPLYVMQLFGHLPGIPGLLLSSVFSASLSTTSSVMNAVAGVVLADFVKPFRPNLSDRHSAILSKIISLVVGSLAMILAVLFQYLGSGLLTMSFAIVGINTGPVLTLFTVGVLFPFVSGRCALLGNIVGIVYSAWLCFGGLINRPYVYQYPVTTAGCNVTDVNLLANISSPVYDPSTWNPQSHYREGVSALYDISYAWLSTGGFLVSLIVTLVSSLILKKQTPVKKKLLASWITEGHYTPKFWKALIDYGDVEEIEISECVKMTTSSTEGEPEITQCGKDF